MPLMIAYQAGRIDAFEALYLALADDVRRFFAALCPSRRQRAISRSRRSSSCTARATPTDRRARCGRGCSASRSTCGDGIGARRWHGPGAKPTRRRRWRGPGPPPDVVGTVAVQRALEQIPAGRRHAWILHHVHGFSFEEIGARLGIGAGAAKLRLSRAMRGLRALLTGDRGRDDE